MPSSAYYDACVFLNALNDGCEEYEACRAFTDTQHITWEVVFSDVCLLDGLPKETLDEHEADFIRNGIRYRRVTNEEVASLQKSYRDLKKVLKQLSFEDKDWKHLMAAANGEAEWLLSTDRDYWDPAAKRVSSEFPKNGPVRKLIRSELGIVVELPSRALGTFGMA